MKVKFEGYILSHPISAVCTCRLAEFHYVKRGQTGESVEPCWCFGWFVGWITQWFHVNMGAETGKGQIWRGSSQELSLRETMTLALGSVKDSLRSVSHHCAVLGKRCTRTQEKAITAAAVLAVRLRPLFALLWDLWGIRLFVSPCRTCVVMQMRPAASSPQHHFLIEPFDLWLI